MKRIIAAAFLVAATLNAPVCADASASGTRTPAAKQTHVAETRATHRKAKPQTSDHEVTYDRDSKDPNVGWHTQGGMRVCTQDCDNPEIPGSGYTCRDVNILGMAMRECDWSSW